MEIWSSVELFQFGPVASAAEHNGRDIYQGQNIRDRIYAWPLTARCRVEEQLVQAGFRDGMSGVPVTGRGLFALEYLLFYPGPDTACPAATTQNAWASLGADTIERRKNEYALASAADVHAYASDLVDAWDPRKGNFQQTFADAAGYKDESEAMNVLAWSLSYVERELKDWKLGIPAGLTMNDAVVPEAPYARLGVENIRANLRGFRSLFQGCGPNGEGIGFDDWLVAAGAPDLAAEIDAGWQQAQNAVDLLPPLDQASTSEVEAAFRAVRALTSPLKSRFFGGGPLGLQLPMTLDGDTD
jgi:predicted lipoprotein